MTLSDVRLIGLHARLHAGKDTAFEFINEFATERGLLAIRRAFADPLKVSGMRSLGLDQDNEQATVALANIIKETGVVMLSWTDEEGHLCSHALTGRGLWQQYGTEGHRASDLGWSFHPDFWVDNLLPQGNFMASFTPAWLDNFTHSYAGFADIAVITDVRFPNEAERVLSLGGEIWVLDSDERLGPNTDSHQSEQRLPDELTSRLISNNTSISDFRSNIRDALMAERIVHASAEET